MAEATLIFNQKSAVADTVETFYTSPPGGLGTRITAFTATNNTVSSKTYKAYIYNSAGALVSAIIGQTIVVPDKSDFGAPIVNQLMPAGGTIRVESSDADSLNFYASGIES